MSTCNTNYPTDYTAGTNDLLGLQVGFAFSGEWEFLDADGEPIDITADSFTLEISQGGAPVDTLTVGSGLTINPTNKLQYLVGSPTTDAAGTYQFILIWAEFASGSNYPVIKGKIVVKP